MKALIKVQHVRRPLSQELIGYRLVAAVPNMEARKMKPRMGRDGKVESFAATDQRVPSFRKPYMISESSDHSMIGKREIEDFIQKLIWEGFDQWELVGNWDLEPIA